MQKTGQIERTVDREFADEEAKYKAFEKETTALQKESKAYLDAMRALIWDSHDCRANTSSRDHRYILRSGGQGF
ncbi:hypothetical protein FRC12_024040 [Ceratobasidium sp. 428]|nr:hypothetical protein FRC12_024040 [Ceratobasidium sp. 428]